VSVGHADGKTNASSGAEKPLRIDPTFAEDGTTNSGWRFHWHGYARLPLRFTDRPLGPRAPDLVDDDYTQSGFAYLRVNETEWVEIALSAQRENTRFVAGFLAANLSDWSDRQGTLSTPATAFIEHELRLDGWGEIKSRVGMFWRRLGYIKAYDTYLIGRVHAAGASMRAQLLEHIIIEAGGGAHARNSQETFGFGPLYWWVAGLEYPWIRANGYLLKTWNDDEDKSRSYTKTGELDVMGFDLNLSIPYVGALNYTLSFVNARNTEFIGRGVELLHSLDGKTLKLNFLGSEGNGTGEIQSQGLELTWEFQRTLRPLLGPAGSRAFQGLALDVYGLATWVATPHETTGPQDLKKNDRRYVKWGTDLRYRPLGLGWQTPFIAFRFDRVIMDTDHDSLGFRVFSPRLGAVLTEGIEVFAQWSHYDYGDNINAAFFDTLAERAGRSGNANLPEIRPDTDVFKIQAQARW